MAGVCRQRRAEAPLAFPHKSFANQIDLFCGQIVAIRQGKAERAEGSSQSKYYYSGGVKGVYPSLFGSASQKI